MTCSFLMFSSLTASGICVRTQIYFFEHCIFHFVTMWKLRLFALLESYFKNGICNISFISSQKHCLKSPHVFRHFPLFSFQDIHDNTVHREGNVARFLSSKWNFLYQRYNHHHVILMTQRLPQLFTLIDCEISIGINPPTMCLSPF